MTRRIALLLLLACAVSFGAGGSPTAQAARRSIGLPTMEIGVNLPGISDWSATPVYVDLVRQGRRFGSPETPWDEAATLGADGWPSGDFGIFLMTGQSALCGTAGTYRV